MTCTVGNQAIGHRAQENRCQNPTKEDAGIGSAWEHPNRIEVIRGRLYGSATLCGSGTLVPRAGRGPDSLAVTCVRYGLESSVYYVGISGNS